MKINKWIEGEEDVPVLILIFERGRKRENERMNIA
jgi:hypothetical protein